MIADALSRRYTLLSQLDCRIFGLESVKEQYVLDPDFKDVLLNCREGRTWNRFMINDGFLFRANPYAFQLVPFCNTSGVLNTKTCHVIICIAKYLALVKFFFDMHSLKQVYLYVECVDLYYLNRVLKVVLNWISENPDFQ